MKRTTGAGKHVTQTPYRLNTVFPLAYSPLRPDELRLLRCWRAAHSHVRRAVMRVLNP